jgi:hypothetical protein|tara:strand:- start:3456 stop:3629 length:174 start_codon:yes stop_codon:yes gene_type:complete
MKIEEWISKLERDRRLTQRQFYAVLKNAINALEDRLSCAESDGVDLGELDLDDEGSE